MKIFSDMNIVLDSDLYDVAMVRNQSPVIVTRT